MFAIGNDELEKMPSVGDTITCPHCGEQHAVEYGREWLDDGWRESKAIAFYKCGDTTYLCGIKGKLINAELRGAT